MKKQPPERFIIDVEELPFGAVKGAMAPYRTVVQGVLYEFIGKIEDIRRNDPGIRLIIRPVENRLFH